MASEPTSSLLLTDATMPYNFCQAGSGTARAMADFLGDRVYLVQEVYDELERKASGFVALEEFLKGWPPNDPRELPMPLKGKVAAALKARAVPGQHQDEDLGETATVFYAEHQRDHEDELFQIVTDDGWGKDMARDRGLDFLTTPKLIVEMVCAEALSYDDGDRVWRKTFSNRAKWPAYASAIDSACSEISR